MENATISGHSAPPSPLFSDYVEIIYLGMVVSFGVPLNIVILRKLLREQRLSHKDLVKCGFVMLKIHLNITDLLILSLALGKLMWLVTYEWLGGDALCRLFQFLSMFALYSSSNIVVCIALDRLRNVLCVKKLHGNARTIHAVTFMASFSWCFAFVCSIPQFFIWRTFNVVEFGGWTQCTDIWQINRAGGATLEHDSFFLTIFAENAYNIGHLFLVFWGPLLVLVTSYVFIATKLMQYSLRPPGLHSVRRPLPTVMEDTARDVIVHVNVDDGLPSQTKEMKKVLECCADDNGRLSLNGPAFHFRPESSTIQRGSGPQSPHESPSLRMPTWRRQLRSRVFRTTLLVILTHFLFWFPYNTLALMKYVNEPIYVQLNDHANIFKDLQIIITLINPFLYGFTR